MNAYSPALLHFLREWAITLTAAGMVCLVLGGLVGWLIWRRTRQAAQFAESRNREALADYEHASEELARVRHEIFREQT
jgi:predicted negative regulator of RcsB-dependent stress response